MVQPSLPPYVSHSFSALSPLINSVLPVIVSVFSAVVLYSNVNYIALTTNTDSFAYNGDGFPAPFSQFSLAVSIITIVTLMPM